MTGSYNVTIYPTLDNGDIDYGHPLNYEDKVKSGENYKALYNFYVIGIKDHFFNTYVGGDTDGDQYIDKAYNNGSH